MGASTLNKKELFRLHMREVEDDYAVLIGDCEYYESQIDSLQDENAKLRGLASGLHQCLDDEGCGGCPMQDDDGWCIRDIRLRELGVVVDG